MRNFQSIVLVTSDPITQINTLFGLNPDHPHVDQLLLDDPSSIGIGSIRQAKIYAASPPVILPQKHLLIPHAHKLTPQAQNALLKLLEEPPPHLRIILAINNLYQLLETVISRCHVITQQTSSATTPVNDLLSSLICLPPQHRLNSLPPTTTKESALEYCADLITSANLHLRQQPSSATSHNLHLLLDCQAKLTQNTNPTLTITNTVLSLLPPPANPATMARL